MNPSNTVQPPAITRFKAQCKLGLFAAIDAVYAIFIAVTWIITAFYFLFRQEPNVHALYAACAVSCVLFQLWVITLAYRILVFILDLQADVNLMPEAAAKIAVGYFEGRKK